MKWVTNFVKQVLVGAVVLAALSAVGFGLIYTIAHILLFIGWDVLYYSLLTGGGLFFLWVIGGLVIGIREVEETKNERQ